MMMHEKAHLIQGFDRKMVEEISNHTQMIDFFNLLSQFKDVNEVNSLEVRDILDIDAELVSEYKSKCTDFIDATGDLTMEKEQKGLIEEAQSNSELMEFLHCTSARASQILKQLSSAECVIKVDSRKYTFFDM